jgi:hypothetical protein
VGKEGVNTLGENEQDEQEIFATGSVNALWVRKVLTPSGKMNRMNRKSLQRDR